MKQVSELINNLFYMRIKRLLYAIATILPFLSLCSCYEEQELQQEKQDKEKWTMQVAGNQLNEFLNSTLQE